MDSCGSGVLMLRNHVVVYVRCLQGRWSVTRPGLLLIAKVDGSLDVWDFTDTSHR